MISYTDSTTRKCPLRSRALVSIYHNFLVTVNLFSSRYKMNLALDELKEQWRVEKAALELAGAQRDIQEVRVYTTFVWRLISLR